MQGLSGTDLLIPLNGQTLMLRFLVALFVGAVVGLERELREKSAGLRTHMLVSLGSAFFVLIPIQLGAAQESVEALSRVLQGIIAGIGFVGGGAILHHTGQDKGNSISGLTTAASIWLSCGLGVAAGCGLWLMAVVGAILALITLSVLKRIERR